MSEVTWAAGQTHIKTGIHPIDLCFGGHGLERDAVVTLDADYSMPSRHFVNLISYSQPVLLIKTDHSRTGIFRDYQRMEKDLGPHIDDDVIIDFKRYYLEKKRGSGAEDMMLDLEALRWLSRETRIGVAELRRRVRHVHGRERPFLVLVDSASFLLGLQCPTSAIYSFVHELNDLAKAEGAPVIYHILRDTIPRELEYRHNWLIAIADVNVRLHAKTEGSRTKYNLRVTKAREMRLESGMEWEFTIRESQILADMSKMIS